MTKTVNDIRSGFLEFFKRNGHEIRPSSSLVPHNDPTLMFTNAGMNQFKNVFTGAEKLRDSLEHRCFLPRRPDPDEARFAGGRGGGEQREQGGQDADGHGRHRAPRPRSPQACARSVHSRSSTSWNRCRPRGDGSHPFTAGCSR